MNLIWTKEYMLMGVGDLKLCSHDDIFKQAPFGPIQSWQENLIEVGYFHWFFENTRMVDGRENFKC